MGRAFGFIGLLIAVAVGAYLYTRQAKSALPAGVTSPKAAIDLTAVKNDLLAIAQAERRYHTMNSKYGTLAELRENGDTNVSDSRGPYSYSVATQDAGFVAKAVYSGDDPAMPKTVSIDQTMQFRND
ncbi:MAG TPA: hypothetical protein VM056_02150 [Terriglobales bacterium]|nr:hypothetical protein [Terriglobales bacterium]